MMVFSKFSFNFLIIILYIIICGRALSLGEIIFITGDPILTMTLDWQASELFREYSLLQVC